MNVYLLLFAANKIKISTTLRSWKCDRPTSQPINRRTERMWEVKLPIIMHNDGEKDRLHLLPNIRAHHY